MTYVSLNYPAGMQLHTKTYFSYFYTTEEIWLLVYSESRVTFHGPQNGKVIHSDNYTSTSTRA